MTEQAQFQGAVILLLAMFVGAQTLLYAGFNDVCKRLDTLNQMVEENQIARKKAAVVLK